jgi:hypothetical protein
MNPNRERSSKQNLDDSVDLTSDDVDDGEAGYQVKIFSLLNFEFFKQSIILF